MHVQQQHHGPAVRATPGFVRPQRRQRQPQFRQARPRARGRQADLGHQLQLGRLQLLRAADLLLRRELHALFGDAPRHHVLPAQHRLAGRGRAAGRQRPRDPRLPREHLVRRARPLGQHQGRQAGAELGRELAAAVQQPQHRQRARRDQDPLPGLGPQGVLPAAGHGRARHRPGREHQRRGLVRVRVQGDARRPGRHLFLAERHARRGR